MTGQHRKTALRIDELAKSFGGFHALSGVSLAVKSGEIHALVGANGSGKSTLIKAISGVQPADSGWLTIGGARHRAATLTAARAFDAGVATVHQELSVFDGLTVAENLALTGSSNGLPFRRFSWKSARAHARAVLADFDLDLDPDSRMDDLRPAMRCMVAVARVLSSGDASVDRERDERRVLLLDEPTALLPHHDVAVLHHHLRREAARGRAIVYVSHRLDEVLSLATCVTVLRDGRVADRLDGERVTEHGVSTSMFGPEREVIRLETRTHGDTALAVTHLAGGDVRDVSLEVRQGEVVGVLGLADSGAGDVVQLVAGVQPRRGGTVEVGGSLLAATPVAARRGGLAYVHGDRGSSVFADQSVADNLTVLELAAHRRGPGLVGQRLRRAATEAAATHGINAPSIDSVMSTLSGGNQQKVVLARWMRQQPSVLVLDDPTAGVDVAARDQLYAIVADALTHGLAALIHSTDLEELALICDRIVVIRDGCVSASHVAPFTGAGLSAFLHEED